MKATDERTDVSLKTILPNLCTNLMSVGRMIDRGFEVRRRKEEVVVLDKKGILKLCVERVDDLYYVRDLKSDATAQLCHAQILI